MYVRQVIIDFAWPLASKCAMSVDRSNRPVSSDGFANMECGSESEYRLTLSVYRDSQACHEGTALVDMRCGAREVGGEDGEKGGIGFCKSVLPNGLSKRPPR